MIYLNLHMPRGGSGSAPDPMLQILQLLTSDREAERAERQVNLATLQQIAQLAHNNQGHGNQDHHGSKLKNFQNTNPPIFTKSEEHLDADDWLQTMENNLEVVGVEANDKVLFATHFFVRDARTSEICVLSLNGALPI